MELQWITWVHMVWVWLCRPHLCQQCGGAPDHLGTHGLGVTLCRPHLCQQCGVAVDHLGTHGLGVTLCRPHLCQQCGVAVDHLGTHGLSCRKSQGHFSRLATINDIVKQSLATTKIPSHPRTFVDKSI